MSFFKAIGLTEKFTVKFGATPSDILSGLRFIMEDRSSDVYGQKTKRFVGRIEADGFKLTRRPNMFDLSAEGFVSAHGQLKEVGEYVFVETKVGVNSFFKIASGIWIFITFAVAVLIISHDSSHDRAPMTFAVLACFLLISLSIQWVIARITVVSFKRELEKNFHKILG